MSNEQYVIWTLIDGQPKRMIVDEVSDTDEGLSIILRLSDLSEKPKQAGKKLKILFDPYVAYRNMDESYRAVTIENHSKGLGETFYTVNNSTWVDWLHKESKGIYLDNDIKHYSIVTIADWIDVLSEFTPEVCWITEQ